jgi:hypothetical protein
MTMPITLKKLTEYEAAKLLKDEKLSKFGPYQCSQCDSKTGFGRTVFEIGGVIKEKEMDNDTQNVIQLHLKQRHGIDYTFFVTHKTGFYAYGAECKKCKSTAIVFDVLDHEYMIRELCKLSGKSKGQVQSEFNSIFEKLKQE